MIGDKGRKKIEEDNSSTRMKNDLRKKIASTEASD